VASISTLKLPQDEPTERENEESIGRVERPAGLFGLGGTANLAVLVGDPPTSQVREKAPASVSFAG
jgi:hypothetical protein